MVHSRVQAVNKIVPSVLKQHSDIISEKPNWLPEKHNAGAIPNRETSQLSWQGSLTIKLAPHTQSACENSSFINEWLSHIDVC